MKKHFNFLRAVYINTYEHKQEEFAYQLIANILYYIVDVHSKNMSPWFIPLVIWTSNIVMFKTRTVENL